MGNTHQAGIKKDDQFQAGAADRARNPLGGDGARHDVDSTSLSKPAKIGTFGGSGGTWHDVQARPSRLVSVTIRSGDVIDAISFTYVGSDELTYTEGPWGGTGGTEDKISLDPDNYVREVSGTTGRYGDNHVVTYLKIATYNGKGNKTYGKPSGEPFRIPVLGGGRVVGFFGRSGHSLDAIGLYIINP